MAIRVIMIGDVVGMPGVRAIEKVVPRWREKYKPDWVIANAENAADGTGLTPTLFDRIRKAGVDGVTLGDHVYKRMQIGSTLDNDPAICRPANLPQAAKGRRWMTLAAAPGTAGSQKPPVYVVTVLGRIFASLHGDDPFACIEEILGKLPSVAPILIVEVHAEASSEKQAMAWYLDGRAAMVFGTHTHVPTADAKILPNGTGYITDLGMTGPYESIIGRRIDRVLIHMTTARPAPFAVASGDVRVCGVMIEIDEKTRKTTKIERLEEAVELD